MGRLSLAWKILTSGVVAAKVSALLSESAAGKLPAPQAASPSPPPAPIPKKPVRNDAVTLLATLQREARLIDFLKEPIDGYTDAQIGAAVRDIHRDSAAVLERQFAIRPVSEAAEGATIPVPTPVDPAKTKVVGPGAAAAEGKAGKLVHNGWQATKCELPTWTGSDTAAPVIAPAELEVT
ncbi:MAG: DUF2760 domain-containing protein [Planctomycetaceae bacterium]|nr:DUF2760 domain-containing protein [Planctomycetaceae bacterium]